MVIVAVSLLFHSFIHSFCIYVCTGTLWGLGKECTQWSVSTMQPRTFGNGLENKTEYELGIQLGNNETTR